MNYLDKTGATMETHVRISQRSEKSKSIKNIFKIIFPGTRTADIK